MEPCSLAADTKFTGGKCNLEAVRKVGKRAVGCGRRAPCLHGRRRPTILRGFLVGQRRARPHPTATAFRMASYYRGSDFTLRQVVGQEGAGAKTFRKRGRVAPVADGATGRSRSSPREALLGCSI